MIGTLDEVKAAVRTAEQANALIGEWTPLLLVAHSRLAGGTGDSAAALGTLRHLLEMKANPLVRDSNTGQMLAHLAAQHGNLDVLQLPGVCLKGEDPAVAGDGSSVLHCAAGAPRNAREMIEWLVRTQGYDVKDRTREQSTPLHYAYTPEACRVLLDCKADVNAINASGFTPLHCADSPEVIRLLLAHGAHSHTRDKQGATAFDVAGDEKVEEILFADMWGRPHACETCGGGGAAAVAATHHCSDCVEDLCSACDAALHRRPRTASHRRHALTLQLCDVDNKVPATVWCADCDESFCAACDAHQHAPTRVKTRGHVRVPISERPAPPAAAALPAVAAASAADAGAASHAGAAMPAAALPKRAGRGRATSGGGRGAAGGRAPAQAGSGAGSGAGRGAGRGEGLALPRALSPAAIAANAQLF